MAINFLGCIFENNVESAIQALSSKMIFGGRNIFRDNSAFAGGGMQLLDSSYMYFQPHTHILFARNHAEEVGGVVLNHKTHVSSMPLHLALSRLSF